MARILGQLACGRCGARFWPRRGESAALVVVCPHCSAAHANPDALPAGPLSTSNRILDAWLRTYWIDGAPRTRVAGIGELLWTRKPWMTYGPLSCVDGCRITKHGPLDAALVHCTYYHRVQRMPVYPQSWTTIFIAAYLPRPDLLADIEGVFAMRGGVVFIETEGDALARAGGLAYELVRRGAEPLFELAQVPDPTPLSAQPQPAELGHDGGASTRVEAERVRCARCGAPSSVAALIGEDARCPHCAAPQSLPGPLASALVAHQRRVHAARLRPKTLLDLTRAWAQPVTRATAPEQAPIACAHCGALNPHAARACTSCREPIVPSERAMRLAEASEAEQTAKTHGRHAGLVELFSDNLISAVAFGAALIVLFMCLAPFIGSIHSIVTGSWDVTPAFLVSEGVMGALVLFLVIFGLVYARWSRARRQWVTDRWLTPVAALADQLGGRLGTRQELVAWASQWWNDRLAPAWHTTSARRAVLSAQSAGFPLAITLDPQGSTGLELAYARAHVDLALAAELPRDVVYRVRQPDARRIVEELARIGFTLDLRTGGLALFANPPLVQHFARFPERVALLAPVATALTQLAHQLDAEPPRAQAAGSI